MEPEAAEADGESSDWSALVGRGSSFATAECMCTGRNQLCRERHRRWSFRRISRACDAGQSVGERAAACDHASVHDSGSQRRNRSHSAEAHGLSARNLAAPSSARQSTGRTKGASAPGLRFASNRIPMKRLRPCLLRRLRKSTCVHSQPKTSRCRLLTPRGGLRRSWHCASA